MINYKNFDYSNLGPHTWNAQKVLFTNILFTAAAATQKFPNCTHMRLERPRNIIGIDFTSFKSLRRLELVLTDSQPKVDVESQLAIVMNQVKSIPAL